MDPLAAFESRTRLRESEQKKRKDLLIASPKLSRASIDATTPRNQSKSTIQIPDDRVSICSLSDDEDTTSSALPPPPPQTSNTPKYYATKSNSPPPPAPTSAVKRGNGKRNSSYNTTEGKNNASMLPPPPPPSPPLKSDFDLGPSIEVEAEIDGFDAESQRQFESVRNALENKTSSSSDSDSDSDSEHHHTRIRPPPRPKSQTNPHVNSTNTNTANITNATDPKVLNELQSLRNEISEIRQLATSRKDELSELYEEKKQERLDRARQSKLERDIWRQKQLNNFKNLSKKNANKFKASSKKLATHISTKVSSSPTLLRLRIACARKICVHCVPYCCLRSIVDTATRKRLGVMIYSRSVVSIGWLHFSVALLFLFIVAIALLTTTYSKPLHDTTYGFSLIFLMGCKSMTCLGIAGLYFRNVDTRTCFNCCLNDAATKSGRGGGRGGSGTHGGGKVGIVSKYIQKAKERACIAYMEKHCRLFNFYSSFPPSNLFYW